MRLVNPTFYQRWQTRLVLITSPVAGGAFALATLIMFEIACAWKRKRSHDLPALANQGIHHRHHVWSLSTSYLLVNFCHWEDTCMEMSVKLDQLTWISDTALKCFDIWKVYEYFQGNASENFKRDLKGLVALKSLTTTVHLEYEGLDLPLGLLSSSTWYSE